MQRKITSVLLLAGVLAAAGVAQAETFDSPQQAGEASTMTGGAPNRLTTNSPYPDGTVVLDTRVLGAGPVVTYDGTTTYYGPATYYYVPPAAMVEPTTKWDGNSGRYASPSIGSYPYYGD